MAEVEKGYWRIVRVLGGLASFVISLIVYARTAQISIPFWDCGEFIACSYTLGVPHPPGAPILLWLGRLVSILPFGNNIAHRLNLLSSFASAVSVMLIYFIIIWIMKHWFEKPNKSLPNLIMIVSGIAGSLLAGFGSTYWNNAVEAEVYGVVMVVINLAIYLTLIWSERREEPSSEKLLVFIPFLLYLGIGIHMTSMIILPPIFLFIILVDSRKRLDPIFWITWAALFSVATEFSMFIIIMISGLILTLVLCLITHGDTARRWALAFITLLMAVIAYTPQLYAPIRSRLDPSIDENDPETLKSFIDYLDRKQYGQESMWHAMLLHRKGSWKNQFGTHRRMGFWGFFRKQWTSIKGGANGVIPFAIGILGIIFAFQRDKRYGMFIFLVVLIGTLGLLVYMNFSDGTRGIQLEVRDRDYFYTPGFAHWGLIMGLGLGGVLWSLYELRKKSRLFVAPLIALLLIVLATPIVPLSANYFTHDRSRNWIPWDYAYNILNSCKKNAVIFTNGDNDTFPLWCIQAIDSVRTDVRVANLSLLNTPWYIKQLKHNMDVPISLSDQKIKMLQPVRTKDGFLRVQDIMVDHIIRNADVVMRADSTYYLDPPIFFAVTVAPENKIGFDPYLRMNGLAYRVVTEKSEEQRPILPDVMRKNLFEVYKFRCWDDTTLYLDENTSKLMQNYVTAFLTLSIYYEEHDSIDKAIETMEYCIKKLPRKWQGFVYLFSLYRKTQQFDKLWEAYQRSLVFNKYEMNIYRIAGESFRLAKDMGRALEVMKTGYENLPDNGDIVKQYAMYLYLTGKSTEGISILQGYTARHPEDTKLKSYLDAFRQEMIRQEGQAPQTGSFSPSPRK